MSFPGIDAWTKFISRVGFPIAAFLLVLFMLREAAIWTGTEVVKPAIRAHVDLVGALQDATQENVKTNANTAESVRRISETQSEQTLLLREVLRHNPPTTASGK